MNGPLARTPDTCPAGVPEDLGKEPQPAGLSKWSMDAARNGRSFTGVIHRTSGLSRCSRKHKLAIIIDRPTLRANGLEICLAQPNGLGG